MQGQQVRLGEAKRRRELPQQLPGAVQEQQEDGGLRGVGGGGYNTSVTPREVMWGGTPRG